jgi:hypothetical protein
MNQLVLPMPAVAARSRMPGEPILRAAEVEAVDHLPGKPCACRWTMTRGWGSGPCIVWVALNPSDLDHFLAGVEVTIDSSEFDGFIGGVPPEWKCLGLTGGGAPVHPLARGRHRVPDDATLQSWRRR